MVVQKGGVCDGTTAGEHGLYNGQIVCPTSESSDPLKSIDGRSQGVKLVRQPWAAAGLANHLVPHAARVRILGQWQHPRIRLLPAILRPRTPAHDCCLQPVYSCYCVASGRQGFNTRCSMPEIANLLLVAWKLVHCTRTIQPGEAYWCGKAEDKCWRKCWTLVSRGRRCGHVGSGNPSRQIPPSLPEYTVNLAQRCSLS